MVDTTRDFEELTVEQFYVNVEEIDPVYFEQHIRLQGTSPKVQAT